MTNHHQRSCSVVLVMSLIAAIGMSVARADSSPTLTGVLDVGSNRQVFIDGRFLAESRDVERVVHPPCKSGEHNVKPDRPWERGGIGPYGSVLYQDGVYHMWYHTMTTKVWHKSDDAGAICYARSHDGITWEKPALGLTEFEGTKANNIVLGHGAAGITIGQSGSLVFHDPRAPSDERYRMVRRLEGSKAGTHLFSSPEGIHWRLTGEEVLTARPQERGHHLDSQNVIFWDTRLKRYVAYGRKNLGTGGSQGRSVARAEAQTLNDFPPAQDWTVVIGPDEHDLHLGDRAIVDYYTNGTMLYPWADDAYYMFPTVYYHYIPGQIAEFPETGPINAGPLHTQFAASRDGIHWQRFDRRPFIDLGLDGEFDCRASRIFSGLLPSADGRMMYMYYLGTDWVHGWDRSESNKKLIADAGLGPPHDTTIVSRVTLRRDGFVSVRGAYTGGAFTTPPLRFAGSELVLNVDTSATGIVRVGLLDTDGNSIEGFGTDDCDRIHTANDINRIVRWKGESDVTRLAGETIRLSVEIRDADLYAFQFRDGRNLRE